MKINEIKQRWTSINSERTVTSKIKEFFVGVKMENKISPFGKTEKSLEDFRGMKFGENINKYLKFENANFEHSVFYNTWLENCILLNCSFEKADFSEYSDHGNEFNNCTFSSVKFNFAVIGYDGTKFKNCVFENSIFTRTNFIRAEFTNCVFKNCKLSGVDFNASSFEYCKFIGKIEDVWFRGEFPTDIQLKEFGKAKKNKMLNVDFSEAELIDLTISDDCDLSTIILPKTGHYQLFNNWKAHLLQLKNTMDVWPENLKKEATIFFDVHYRFADKQEWALINLDELKKEYGEDLTNNIMIALNVK